MRLLIMLVALSIASPVMAEPIWEIDFTFTVTSVNSALASDSDPSPIPIPGVQVGDSFDGFFRYSTTTDDPTDLMGPSGEWRWQFDQTWCQCSTQDIGPHNADVRITDSFVDRLLLSVSLGPNSIDIDTNHSPNAFGMRAQWQNETGGYGYHTVLASMNVGPVTSVPEPSTLLLFSAGFMALGFVRRRK